VTGETPLSRRLDMVLHDAVADIGGTVGIDPEAPDPEPTSNGNPLQPDAVDATDSSSRIESIRNPTSSEFMPGDRLASAPIASWGVVVSTWGPSRQSLRRTIIALCASHPPRSDRIRPYPAARTRVEASGQHQSWSGKAAAFNRTRATPHTREVAGSNPAAPID
jgi:hypothetical protein